MTDAHDAPTIAGDAVDMTPAPDDAQDDAPAALGVAPERQAELEQLRGDRYLTREQLEVLADQLTMGDVWRARLEAPDDRDQQGVLLFLIAARRIGLVPTDTDLVGFLDRVRNDDFTAIMAPNSARRLGKSTGS